MRLDFLLRRFACATTAFIALAGANGMAKAEDLPGYMQPIVGGKFILYRPGQPPLDAPSVPVVHQLLKSIGHSTMALAEVVGPYLNSPDDQASRGRCSPIAAG